MGRGFYDYGKSMDEVSKREIKIHENVATRRKLLLPRLFITSKVHIIYFIINNYSFCKKNKLKQVRIHKMNY